MEQQMPPVIITFTEESVKEYIDKIIDAFDFGKVLIYKAACGRYRDSIEDSIEPMKNHAREILENVIKNGPGWNCGSGGFRAECMLNGHLRLSYEITDASGDPRLHPYFSVGKLAAKVKRDEALLKPNHP